MAIIREGDKLTGKVTNFGKGYGFIKVAKFESEFFVHFNDIISDGFRTLHRGSTVEFTAAVLDNGKLKAVNVVCIATPPPSSAGRLRETSNGVVSNNNCFFCHKTGHFARQCPNKPAAGDDVECFICHNLGHISRNCPDRSNVGGGRRREERVCNNCGRVGHLAKNCRPASTGGGRRCHNCKEVGHLARDCTEPLSGGGGRRVEDRECHYCNEVGHLARDCPEGCDRCEGIDHSARDCRARFADKECFVCKGIGHIAKDCPNGDGGGAVRLSKSCYNCGDPNHLARDCTAASSED